MASIISEKLYTYQDYKNLDVDDNFWYELINGELVQKSSPSPNHQRISRKLLLQMVAFVEENQLGEVFYAPIDVFLDNHNAPQPDLVFVSTGKKALVTDDGIMGPPDLVVEIISPSSVKRDRMDKMRLYGKHRIPEFWLIDPNNTSVEVYVFQEGDYGVFALAAQTGTVQSGVLQGFSVDVQTIFG